MESSLGIVSAISPSTPPVTELSHLKFTIVQFIDLIWCIKNSFAPRICGESSASATLETGTMRGVDASQSALRFPNNSYRKLEDKLR